MQQQIPVKDSPLPLKPHILIADDDEDLLLLMKIKMKSEGFEVQISPNGDDLFDLLETSLPDIILLDITMRGVDGGTICKDLKKAEKTKNIPVILFSANHNIESITQECGADGYILKPFNNKTIKTRIFQILSLKQSLNS